MRAQVIIFKILQDIASTPQESPSVAGGEDQLADSVPGRRLSIDLFRKDASFTRMYNISTSLRRGPSDDIKVISKAGRDAALRWSMKGILRKRRDGNDDIPGSG